MRTVLLTTVVVFLAAVPAVGQQSPVPGSPRMIAVEAVHEILNAEEPMLAGVLDRVVDPGYRESMGDAEFMELIEQIRTRLGGQEAMGLRPVGPTTAEMTFETTAGAARITVTVTSSEPHRITEIVLDDGD